jgi:ADP-dependent NAD(P)H-hydrate dehydratase / NAD(P)H-hydrate epimerase
MKLLSTELIREWDEYTIQHEPISSIDLMERAASKCTEWLIDNDLIRHPVKIFCGTGNNGGDGLAIARQLIEKEVDVDVYIFDPGKGSDDLQANLTKLQELSKEIHFIRSAADFPPIHKKDMIIDALFGSGLNRNLTGLPAALIDHINHSNANVISIDLPSGMFPDGSSKGNTIIKASHTLTFQCPKLCLLMAENSEYFGKVQVLDIGLHHGFLHNVSTDYSLPDLTDIQAIYKPRKPFSHKGDHGHALIIGGAEGKAGAAIIATEACLRTGAGLTTVHLLNGDNTAINARCPEAMTLAGDELVKKNLSRFTSIAIGPGLGTDDIAGHLVSMLVENYKGRLVIDADGLNVLSQHKDWLQQLPAGVILTPHPKEFDRLFGEHTDEFARWQTSLTSSKELKCIIVLKGHYSLIAINGKGHFNTTGNAGLAKGGSGDALTGIIVSLLAQGYGPALAAKLGVFIHGLAADLAVEEHSYESLIASDVIASLGKAFKKLPNVS